MIWTLIAINVCLFVGWRVVSRRWLAHEERQAEEARRTLDKIMRASTPPAAAGWPHRKVSR